MHSTVEVIRAKFIELFHEFYFGMSFGFLVFFEGVSSIVEFVADLITVAHLGGKFLQFFGGFFALIFQLLLGIFPLFVKEIYIFLGVTFEQSAAVYKFQGKPIIILIGIRNLRASSFQSSNHTSLHIFSLTPCTIKDNLFLFLFKNIYIVFVYWDHVVTSKNHS